MTDNDPRAQAMLRELFTAAHLSPGMGLGTPTWAPTAGLQRERQRRMAQGMSAQERFDILTRAGVTDSEGMRKVFARAYTSPEKAFMLGGK